MGLSSWATLMPHRVGRRASTLPRDGAVRRAIPLRSAALSTVAALVVACAGAPGGTTAHVVDLDGRAVDPFANVDAPATVLVFVRTDCPISNRYAPEIRRLYESFVDRGVDFWMVYPGPAGTPDEIREHRRAFDLPLPPLFDPRHELVQLVEATVTPEVAVFDASGKLAYRGRIDDRYVDFGKSRVEPEHRDLQEALLAVLDGNPVEAPRTRAIGCYIADLR